LVDTGAMRTWRGCIWRVQEALLEDTTARSAPGGYRGQADLTGMEDKARGVSTVSLNRDEGMGTEETG
jgi:hypothetical protein